MKRMHGPILLEQARDTRDHADEYEILDRAELWGRIERRARTKMSA
jgi:hypothetical protein